MRRRLIGASLLLAAFIVLPGVEVYAQKKKKADDKPVSKTIDSGKLGVGEYFGTLKSVPGTDRVFLLETEAKQLVPTGKGGGGGGRGNNIVQMQNQLAQAQRQLATATTPQARQRAMQNFQQVLTRQQRAMAGLKGGAPPGYKVDVVKREIEFQASEKAKVRTMTLPEQFDEKGNLKKFTAKELAELRGKDTTLPGYESAMEKLEAGQKIRVTLTPAPANAAAKNKDQDEDAKADKRMQVKLIVIVAESTGDGKAMGKAKKKK